MENENDQAVDQEFNLDNYRNLLDRLQASKRNQERLDKKIPGSEQQPIV